MPPGAQARLDRAAAKAHNERLKAEVNAQVDNQLHTQVFLEVIQQPNGWVLCSRKYMCSQRCRQK